MQTMEIYIKIKIQQMSPRKLNRFRHKIYSIQIHWKTTTIWLLHSTQDGTKQAVSAR